MRVRRNLKFVELLQFLNQICGTLINYYKQEDIMILKKIWIYQICIESRNNKLNPNINKLEQSIFNNLIDRKTWIRNFLGNHMKIAAKG